ncbi:MAG: OmpA family protein [Bacteroidales bacterium]|nr:OmpA family protein [Bacteroidales bacterium]MCB9000001.1 OmpA family protein [Bacteroidales bacterium]MCB9013269.1 OmpA family protein [Bacteroidales bacterium]
MIKYRYLLAILILGLVSLGQVNAQKKKEEVKIKRSEFKIPNAEGFQDAWLAVLDANEYFAQGIGTYNLARDLFLKAHQYNSENPELNYFIGVCYLYTDDKYEAIKYLRKAYEKKPGISPDINYLLGRAYHLVLEFDKAIEQYNSYLQSLPPAEKVIQSDAIDKLIIECRNGKDIIGDRKRLIISNLGDSINSAYDDYNSVFASNDSVIYFTSRRPMKPKSKRNPYDNKFYEDVYTSSITGGAWSAAVPLSKKINGKHNDAVVGISKDDNELYIYRGENKGGEIYASPLKKGKWKSPGSWVSRFSSDESESSVFFTQSGDTVYFISANKDLTLGGKDIMISYKNAKGKWMKPTNLSSLLNTKYDEEGLFLTPDGNTLYFSSRGHNTMGGFDVFKSVMQDDGTWSDPVNMGYPVNTPDDELFFCLSANGKAAYLSTIRDGGIGAKDIYKLVFLGSEKEMILENEDILIAGIPDGKKIGFFTIPEAIPIDSFYYLKGRVLNKSNDEPVVAKLEFVDPEESKVIATAISNDQGEYQAKFLVAKNYGVEIVAKDYLFFLDVVNMDSATTDEPYIHDFHLEKVEVGTKVVLENIYFETNKATLTAASYPQLNQVVTFLQNNETIHLEISGHTDNVGSLKANMKLSEDRAKAVVDYFIANGIDKSRLEAKGYAFNQPIAPNDTPEGREKNRRVEFKVISK